MTKIVERHEEGFTFLLTLPNPGLMIVSVSNSDKMGSLTLAIPGAVSRLDGGQTSDAGDRLSRLLARKYDRQVMVMYSIPSPPSMDEEKMEDKVMRRVIAIIREIMEE